MSPRQRKQFDELLDGVVAHLPTLVLDLMAEVPLIIEDYPSRALMREVGITQRDELCGVFQGVAISEPEFEPGREHSDQVLLFREGILSQSASDDGTVTDDELRRQIRITILHEYGHHFGLDEAELEQLGYD